MLPVLETTKGAPMKGPFVGCPWQKTNPEAEEWTCDMLIAQRAPKTECMKEECDQYRKHTSSAMIITQHHERARDMKDRNARGPSPGTHSQPADATASTPAGGEGDGSILEETGPASQPS
jgi:hypothetical protein